MARERFHSSQARAGACAGASSPGPRVPAGCPTPSCFRDRPDARCAPRSPAPASRWRSRLASPSRASRQIESMEVTLPIGRDAPAAGVVRGGREREAQRPGHAAGAGPVSGPPVRRRRGAGARPAQPAALGRGRRRPRRGRGRAGQGEPHGVPRREGPAARVAPVRRSPPDQPRAASTATTPSAGAATTWPRGCGRRRRCRSPRSRTVRRWRSWSSTGRRALNEVTVIDEDEAGWSRIARPATGDLLVVGWVKQKQLGKPPARDTAFAAFGAGGFKPAGAGGAAGRPGAGVRVREGDPAGGGGGIAAPDRRQHRRRRSPADHGDGRRRISSRCSFPTARRRR